MAWRSALSAAEPTAAGDCVRRTMAAVGRCNPRVILADVTGSPNMSEGAPRSPTSSVGFASRRRSGGARPGRALYEPVIRREVRRRFGRPGPSGMRPRQQSKVNRVRPKGRPQRAALRHRRERRARLGALLRPGLVQSATWIDHS